MDIVIITGASRGIGLELLKQLQGKGKKVYGLARSSVEKTENSVSVNLIHTERLEDMLYEIIDENKMSASSFTLINNAGTVDPIGLAGSVNTEELVQAMTVNLTAPMILTNAFIARLVEFKGKKSIVNISSGAGRKPYEGWSVYCTTKAGLDHYTRVVALEQKEAAYPVGIVAIAPGIIDTGMQETIRASEASDFPLLQRFVDYKAEGKLSSAAQTAEKLIRFIEENDLTTMNPIADIREF